MMVLAGSTTAPPGQTTQQVRTTTSVPGAGGCPSFDFSACNPNCVVMDSRGCLTCHCAGSSFFFRFVNMSSLYIVKKAMAIYYILIMLHMY